MQRINAERARYARAKPAVYLGGALPGLLGAGRRIRRRALLIACSYPVPTETNLIIGDRRFLSPETDVDVEGESREERKKARERNLNTRQVDLPRALPNALNDLFKVYRMLVDHRGFSREEIVVLTDGADSNPLVRSIKEDGVRIEHSNSENVLQWMCRLGSGLGSKPTNCGAGGAHGVEDVSTSLFLYYSGHGSSRPEFAPQSPLTTHQQAVCGTEEDLRDEMLLCSDYKRVRLPMRGSVRAGSPWSAIDSPTRF